MGQGLGIGDVVDGHDLHIVVPVRRPQKQPADPAETVYRDFHFHG
jgi:hypothetical protein